MDAPVICPRCGTKLESPGRFCPACGAPLEERPRAERRLVTVLFGDLSGFTALAESLDAEEVKALIDATFDAVGDIVERFGGHVDKIIGDEVMAVFGAPQAHEDDAARAVRAALAITAELERRSAGGRIPLTMHIGLNTGEVVAGYVGGSDAYTVLGDAVNTARRIQEIAAPGQILVGEATRVATEHEISYRGLGRVAAKGKRAPVAVWEVLGERDLPGARRHSDAPLVGRDEELRLLGTALDLVRRDAKPLLVSIVGDAGLGKSRIAAEFAARARADGVRVVVGRSLPYDTASPTATVEEMVRGALVMDAGIEDPEMARAWIAERMDSLGVGSETEHVLSFLGLREGSPRGGHAALLRTAWLLLEELARSEGALVLMLHEMHWADSSVLSFARELTSGRAPILVVCLGRPELLEHVTEWPTQPGTMLIELQPLPLARAEEMLDMLAPGLHPSIRGSVLDRAGGNPFYIEELARLMVGRPAGESLAVPGTVQALVTARIDELGDRGKRILQDASVIGTRFWTGALDRLGTPGVAGSIRDLVAGAWIEPETESTIAGETEYRFRQAIVRDVAYASVPKQARALQHAAVGAWLEDVTSAGPAPEESFDLVAHHFERAAVLAAEIGAEVDGAAAKAAEYLERAGNRALALDAAGAASDFFQRALAFPGDAKDELRRRVALADALVGAFRTRHAHEALDAGLALAEDLGDVPARAKLLRLRSDLFRLDGAFEEAAAPLDEAIRLARDAGDQREIAECLRSVGLLDLPNRRWTHAVDVLTEAAERYRALGDERGEAWCLANLGNARSYLLDLDAADLDLTRAVTLFRGLGDAEGAAFALSSRALARMLGGQPASALEDVAAAEEEERTDRFGRPVQAPNGFTVAVRASAELLTGRIETALRHAAPSEAGPLARGWAPMLSTYVAGLGAYLLDDLEAAGAAAVRGHAIAVRTDPVGEMMFAALSALVSVGRGEAEAAWAALEPLMSGTRAEIALVRYAAATTLHALGRSEEAVAHLDASLGQAALGLISPAWTRALRAAILAEKGDDRALEAARDAVDEAGEDALARALALRALVAAIAGTAASRAAVDEALEHASTLEWPAEKARLVAL